MTGVRAMEASLFDLRIRVKDRASGAEAESQDLDRDPWHSANPREQDSPAYLKIAVKYGPQPSTSSQGFLISVE